MNREIKFRAWDRDTKKMVYGDADHRLFDFTGIIHTLISYQVSNGTYRTRIGRMLNGEIMQFTGLKDKNGREIYEGDVVKVESATGMKEIAQIKMVDGCWDMIYVRGYRDYLKCSIVNYAVEVIGNTHENPELLKG